jgi:hypothetical protein
MPLPIKEALDWIVAAKKPLAWLGASGVLIAAYRWVLRMFTRLTDVECGYNWSFDGPMDNPRNIRPNLDVRNRSQSRTYRLGNISYVLRGAHHWCDNKSVWGKELKPGSIELIDGMATVPRIASLQDCMEMTVILRSQDNREFRCWGPGQQRSKWRYRLHRLRLWMDKASVSLDS